jgi:hypothetical protein
VSGYSSEHQASKKVGVAPSRRPLFRAILARFPRFLIVCGGEESTQGQFVLIA